MRNLGEAVPLALTAGLVTAAIEYPISRHYATIPATPTGTRMLIAGGMASAAVLIAHAILRALPR
jgi:hypothetical protein